MTDTYNLHWDTFSENLQLMFKELHEEGKHSDVTLVCDDKTQFKAHKMVLGACSPVFKRILVNNPSEHPLIYLCGIRNYEMKSILQLMYLGEGNFCSEKIEEIVKFAEDLEIKGFYKGPNVQEDVTDETVMDDIENEYEPRQITPETPADTDGEQVGLFVDYNAEIKKEVDDGTTNLPVKQSLVREASILPRPSGPPGPPAALSVQQQRTITLAPGPAPPGAPGGGGVQQIILPPVQAGQQGQFILQPQQIQLLQAMQAGLPGLSGLPGLPLHMTNSPLPLLGAPQVQQKEKEKKKKKKRKRKEEKDVAEAEDIAMTEEDVTDDIAMAEENALEDIAVKEEDVSEDIAVKEEDISEDFSIKEEVEETAEYDEPPPDSKIKKKPHRSLSVCPDCGKVFNQKYTMLEHHKAKHQNIKYPCDQCSYQATTQGSLKQHIRAKHEGIKYPCPECDYQATEKGSLKKHIQSKHENISYACNECDYQGASQSNLQRHLQSKHKGKKKPM